MQTLLGVGRKKKVNSVLRSYRMSKLVIKMIELYGSDRSMDNTAALNNIAMEYLSSLGYRQRAEDLLKAEESPKKFIGGIMDNPLDLSQDTESEVENNP